MCVRSLDATQLGACGSLPLIKLQSSRWLRLQSLEGLSGAGASASKKAHCWWGWDVSLSLGIARKPPHYMHLSIGLLECLGIAAGLPQSEQGGSQNILYLSLGSQALSSATFSVLEIT